MTEKPLRKIRCAIYTRKSSEEGLDMEFNSLDAQRESGEAYIISQRHEGWIEVADQYDDGGFSGGSMERPALKRLLADVQNGRIDVIVVYKVDRLSRSLADFAKMVELFDQHKVSFVSVTQQFNTTTSMGRLTLNILLSFAQFEREVIGERIRDKFAASKRKGMWMGGTPPLGYDIHDRKLVINEKEATQIRHIFTRFTQLQSITMLTRELREQGYRSKSFTTQNGRVREGQLVTKSFLYNVLNNRLYLGEISHKGKPYPGLHQPIISQELWEEAHAEFVESPQKRAAQNKAKTPALLKGLLRCGGCQSTMTPSHTRKKGKLYRYYCPTAIAKGKCDHCPIGTVPAGEIEETVMQQLRAIFASPEMVVKTYKEISKHGKEITEPEIMAALQRIDPVWEELFPAEQSRILHLLVEKAELYPDSMDITLNISGIHTLTNDLQGATA